MNNLRAAWEQIPGGLKQISVSRRDAVWGVNNGGQIYRYNLSTKSWDLVQGGLTQISVAGNGTVMGVNSADAVWRYRGVPQWENLPNLHLDQISVGSDGTIWGLHEGKIFHLEGDQLVQIAGGLKQISVGGKDHIWGVNRGDEIFRFRPETKDWEKIDGLLTHVSASATGEVWGVNRGGEIFKYFGDLIRWQKFQGPVLSQINVGDDGTVWGLHESNQTIFRLGAEEPVFQSEVQFQVRIGLNQAEYEIEAERWERRGYRPTHVSGYEHKNESHYHVIWEKKSGLPFKIVVGLTSQQMQDWFDQNAVLPWATTFIDTHVVNGQMLHSVIIEQGAPAARVRVGMTHQKLFDFNRQYIDQGFWMGSLSAFELNGQDYYSAVWPRPGESTRSFDVRQNGAEVLDVVSRTGLLYEMRQVQAYNFEGEEKFAYVANEISDAFEQQTQLNITFKEFRRLTDELGHQGFNPTSISGQVKDGKPLVSATWSRRFQAKLFSEENFQGKSAVVSKNIDNLADSPWRSLKLSHRTGVKLFEGVNRTGKEQPLFADIPNIRESRLAKSEIGSLQILPNPRKPYRGSWGIKAADGRFLSAGSHGILTNNLSSSETFSLAIQSDDWEGWFDDRDNSSDGWVLQANSLPLFLLRPHDLEYRDQTLIFGPGGDTDPNRNPPTLVAPKFALTQEGRRHFSLSLIVNGSRQWVRDPQHTDQMIAAGRDFRFWFYDGTNWNPISPSSPDIPVESVTAAPDGLIYGILPGNLIARKTDLKASWETIPSSLSLRGLTIMPDGTFVGVGEDFRIYSRHSLESAPDWTLVANSGSNVNAVAAAPDGRLFAAGADQQIYYRINLNAPWQRYPVQTPAFSVAVKKDPNQTLLVMGPDFKTRTEINGEFIIDPNETFIDARDIAAPTNPFRFSMTNDESERGIFKLAVKVANDESEIERLETGDVALYENKNFWGKTWVVNGAIKDIEQIEGLKNNFLSARVGGHTDVTLVVPDEKFVNGEFLELNRANPSLPDLVSGELNITEIEPIVIDTPADIGLTYHTELSQDMRLRPGETESELDHYKAYRTTMRFPKTVEYVDVWSATAQTQTIEVGIKTYEIDGIKAVRLQTNELGCLVVTTEATGLSTPGLALRTNTMKGNERVVIFSDQAVHERLAALDEQALWTATDENEQPLLNRDQFQNPNSVLPIVNSVSQMMKTVDYHQSNIRIGVSNSRSVNANLMDDDQWQLQFFDSGPIYTPLDHADVAELTGLPIPNEGEAPLSNAIIQQQTRDLSSRSLGSLWNELTSGVHKIEQLIVHTGEGVKNQLNQVENSVVATYHYLDNGSKTAHFIIDEAEKTAGVVHSIFHAIGTDVNKAVEWLHFVFNWQDVLHTHQVFVNQINQGLDYLISTLESGKGKVTKYIQNIENEIDGLADKMRAQINRVFADTNPNPPTQTLPPDQEKHFNAGHEKLDWFLSKTVDHHHATPNSMREISFGRSALNSVEGLLSSIEARVADDQNLNKAMQDVREKVQEAWHDPSRIVENMALILVDIFEIVIDLILDVIDVLIVEILELMATLLRDFKEVINQPWAAPFASELYGWATNGESLTTLNFVCLVSAIPTTIVSKLVGDAAPFQPVQARTRSEPDPDFALKRDYGLANSFFAIGGGVISSILDLQPATGIEIFRFGNNKHVSIEDTYGAGHRIRGNNSAIPSLKLKNDTTWEIVSLLFDIAGMVTSWPGGTGFAHVDFSQELQETDAGEYFGNVSWLVEFCFMGFDVIFLLFGHRMRRSEQIGVVLDFALGLTMFGLVVTTAVKEGESKGNEFKLRILPSNLIQGIFGVLPDVAAPLRHPRVIASTDGTSLLIMSGIDAGAALTGAVMNAAMAFEGLIDPLNIE